MAHLSGTFSHPDPGRLQISLSGTFFQDTYRDAGFPSTAGGGGNILLRAYFGPSGSYSYSEPIDRYAPSVAAEVDYPGGNVAWNLGTEEVAHQNPGSGIWSYGMGKLRLTVVLRKK